MFDKGTTARHQRERAWAIGALAVALAVSGGFFGIAAHHGNSPRSLKAQASAATDYHVYVTAYGNTLVEFDSTTGKLLADINVPRESDGTAVLDSPFGDAATPDGSQVFVADEGKYNVDAIDTATNTPTEIIVGAFPQDVAVSPDGSEVYVTLTGPDTGPGGPHQLAVISTATDKVTGHINVGNSPRQVVFSPDGSRAYVTTERSIDVVNTATGTRVASIPDTTPGGPQDLAVSPDGATVYVTNPVADTLTEINTATDRVKAVIPAGDEPYAVAVSADSKSVYVTDMNSNSVRAIDATTNRTTTNITVGGMPSSIAFTPDGSELWVGNILQGDVSVIDPTTNTVARTVTVGLPTQETIDGAPASFAFVKG